MKSLSTIAEEHKNQVKSGAPFILLLEIEVPSDPVTRIRLAQFDKTVAFEQNTQGEDILYYPAPMSVGTSTQTSAGDLPTLEVSIAMSGPLLFLDLDQYDGFTDQPIRVIVVSSLDLTGAPIVEEEATVVSLSMNNEAISITISGSDLFQSVFPHIVYSRTSCHAKFGGIFCQYDVNATLALYRSCGVDTTGTQLQRPFSYEACVAAGDDEEDRGLTRKHPDMWGGERGIPRG